MAMLASKSPYPALGISSGHAPTAASSQYSAGSSSNRIPAMISSIQNVASPTESEFSEIYEGNESIRNWDEKDVADWLRSINCGQYVELFRANNFNGENLMECDQASLKDIGVKKVGDRVRLNVHIKQLRGKTYGKQRKRTRDSFALLDSAAYTPSSSGSPRHPTSATSARERSNPTPPAHKRWSRQIDASGAYPYSLGKPSSRPSSPLAESHKNVRSQQHLGMSPMENVRREQTQGYFGHPNSASSSTGKRPVTPGKLPQYPRIAPTHRQNPSIDGHTMGQLPPEKDIIRVISNGGDTRVFRVQNFKTSDEIIHSTLKKFGLPENHIKNYRFYVLSGTEPDPTRCRPISEDELVRICSDTTRAERSRLILRKIHAGEPGEAELQRSAQIATEEAYAAQLAAINNGGTRTQRNLTKLTGEDWETIRHQNDSVKHPLSPSSFNSLKSGTSANERAENVNEAAYNLERSDSQAPGRSVSKKIRQFFGQRPPSELISSDLASYFPDHKREEIERTVRMSMRRSARLSRATSRLSTASNFSFASSMRDAPPIPTIAETWLNGSNPAPRQPRPLSISKMGLPATVYRDSVASSVLEPLQEESPTEPDRKSYVSFESGSESANINVIDPDGKTALQSYFDDMNGSSSGNEAGGSLNEHLSQIIAEDGEGHDEELNRFLAGDSFENVQWMKGNLIGQGSFGSVYIALHSMTGELMAVKQVETPTSAGSQIDAKKKNMVEALQREIALLKGLEHPNIVQYLGSSTDEDYLNIFLEYVPGGSVAGMLNQYGHFPEPLIRNFVRQILIGLSYLHGQDIIHRDIKGANVLVDNKGGIKISDFGISKRVELVNLTNKSAHHRPSLQGSVFWMAPEVVKQTAYTLKADIWSLGCLIVEMFTGTHPFPDCSQLQAIFKIGNKDPVPTIPDEASEEGRTFMKRTFELDHEMRPSADELLLSPFAANRLGSNALLAGSN
ncbi:MAG: ATP binding [Candelina mexicana]|nr:MAG: ATP binding [Candelina mexicana]